MYQKLEVTTQSNSGRNADRVLSIKVVKLSPGCNIKLQIHQTSSVKKSEIVHTMLLSMITKFC